MGGKSDGQIVGYKYFMGLHMGLCRGPINALVQIQVGKRTAWPRAQVTQISGGNETTTTRDGQTNIWPLASFGAMVETTYTDPVYSTTPAEDPATSSGTIYINAPDLFGGDHKEGGILGSCDVMMGEATQGQNANLIAMLGDSLIGAFRGIVTLFYDGEISALNPYPKPWRFRLRRTTMGWDGAVFESGSATIILNDGRGEIHAMNPAHILFECLTNKVWGRGLSRDFIDTASFASAAATLYSEGFGLCLSWSRQDTIESFAQKVIDHIGAVLHPSRETGLLKLRLIRGDYSLNQIPSYSTSNGVIEILEDEESSPDALTSEVIVSYVDPITGEKTQTRVQNLGVMQAVGAVNSKTIEYPGLPTRALANRIAQRDLKVHSSSLRRMTLAMNRQAWRIAPGDVFQFNDTRRGIVNLVLRVGRVEDAEDGRITVQAVQDMFTLAATSYVAAPPDVPPPSTIPVPATYEAMYEVSYWDLVRRLTTAELSVLTETETYIYLIASAPVGVFSLNYSVYTAIDGAEPKIRGIGNWAQAGALTAPMNTFQFSLFVSIGSLPSSLVVGTPGMVENEVVRIDAYNYATGEVTISRGCLDTIPQTHPAGAPFWVLNNRVGPDSARYAQTETIVGKVLTNTVSGQLHPSVATELSLTTESRHPRPYPPAFLLINDDSFARASVVQPDFVVTWVHRNRVSQNDVLFHQFNDSVTPEAGQTYTIQIRLQSDNSLVREVTGITGQTWTYTSAFWATDGSPSEIFFDMFSVRGGWDSWQRYHVPLFISNAGWGLNWGNNWGGS